ncbi:hypothetical protein VB776_03450 [Arcicella sp. DC2W]|uniref:Uncharacterized protein n=1 Tax=Arcicella gelida TaxID=2984195 RepID=A0ABU5S0Y5_9BACT|nr:hypothetical protein [Arcicella sp. DC2W]MEA5401958.1 hypothetical protein [Arcicella sp. DC2W]
MKKYFLLLVIIFSILVLNKSYGQISVYFCEKTGAIGIATGVTNEGFERDERARVDCINKGGESPWPIVNGNNIGSGCYAVVRGRTASGANACGVAYGGNRTIAQCIEAAKREAIFRNATENSLSVYTQGCVEPLPPQKSPNNNQTPTVKPEWSDWRPFTAQDCNLNIEYRYLVERGFALNYQVHMWFEVRNNNNKTVSYTFNLLDSKDKVHFGDKHTTNPGETTRFVHKMSGDYIKKWQPKDIVYTTTGRPVCEKEVTQQVNNQNNPSNDSQKANQTSSQTNIMELISKKNNLCEEFNNLIKNGGNANPTFVDLCTGNQSNYSINDHARLNNEIARLESAISIMNKQTEGKTKTQEEQQRKQNELQKRQQEEQERIRKAQEAKRAQFDGAIQNGDNALNSKQYDNAMSYYSLAKNYAQNSNESTFAQNKYNQAFEAKKTAERQVRVAKQQEKDKKENLEYAGLATSVGGMMALLNDSYSYKWYAMKFQAGLGYENFPIYSNNASQYHVNNSYIESFTLPTFHMGFKSGFFNNKGVSFMLNPLLNAGFSALSAGTSGGYVEYGSTATLYLSHKSRSKFKVFAEGGYFNREGNYSYDADAANGGNSATDDVRKGTFKYDIMKYGGGFMYHLIYDGKETYMRPAVFFEKPSFFTKDDKPVLNFNFQVNISSEIIFDFNYSTDYFIGGDVTYPTTLQSEKMKYFSIKIIKQGKLY